MSQRKVRGLSGPRRQFRIGASGQLSGRAVSEENRRWPAPVLRPCGYSTVGAIGRPAPRVGGEQAPRFARIDQGQMHAKNVGSGGEGRRADGDWGRSSGSIRDRVAPKAWAAGFSLFHFFSFSVPANDATSDRITRSQASTLFGQGLRPTAIVFRRA